MYSILNMEKMSYPAASADARVLSHVLNYPSSFFFIFGHSSGCGANDLHICNGRQMPLFGKASRKGRVILVVKISKPKW